MSWATETIFLWPCIKPENFARFPLAGEPDVVTVPVPAIGVAQVPAPFKNVLEEHDPDQSA